MSRFVGALAHFLKEQILGVFGLRQQYRPDAYGEPVLVMLQPAPGAGQGGGQREESEDPVAMLTMVLDGEDGPSTVGVVLSETKLASVGAGFDELREILDDGESDGDESRGFQ